MFSLKCLASIAILLSLGAFIYGLWQNPQKNTMLPSSSSVASDLGSMEQISYTSWEDNRPVWTVDADRFAISRRGYMAFKVRFLYEAVLDNARFKLFKRSKQQNTPFFSHLEEISSLHAHNNSANNGGLAMRYITQVVVRPFSLIVYENDNPFMSVKAKFGVVKGKNKRVKFSDFSIENLDDHRTITSKKAFWDEKQKKFLIPGSYLATTPKGQAQGRGIGIGLDFSLASLP